MDAPAARLPAGLVERFFWIAGRVLAWSVLYIVFELIAAPLMDRLPIASSGPFTLLRTGTTLVAAVLAGVILLRWLDHRPAADLGFPFSRAAPRLFAQGFVIGAGALLFVVAIMVVAGWLTFRADDGNLGSWGATLGRDLLLLGSAAAAEEAMFRGYAFQVVARAQPLLAVLLGSSVFAWAHAGNPKVGDFAFVNIFLAGVLLSVAFLLTHSLWFATALHAGWNWSMASLVDLPVSGLQMFNTPLYEPELRGPVWFTGGEFGPEGGLSGTIAFLAALGLVWAIARRRRNHSSNPNIENKAIV